MKRPHLSTASRKRGGKRKIPILSQDRMPIYEEDSFSNFESKPPSPSQPLVQFNNTPLPMILKKREPILSEPFHTEEPISQQQEDEGEDYDGANEDLLSLLGGNSRINGLGAIPEPSEAIRSRIEASKDFMRLALPLFTEEQRIRYGPFRKSALPRPLMKKWMQAFLGYPVNTNMAIIGAGVAKVFVGELLEAAKDVSIEWGDSSGPLLPSHIREGYRRMAERPGCLDPKSFARTVKRRRYSVR